MDKLKNKSGILKESANYLHDRGYYAGVPHCSYYSCYQLMTHICVEKMYKNCPEQMQGDLSSSPQKNGGIHSFVINKLERYVRENLQYDDFKTFMNNVSTLKHLRIKADYQDVDISCTDSSQAINLSESVTKILKKIL